VAPQVKFDPRGILLAPDLRHTRARMKRDVAAAWLREPQGFMPKIPLTNAERADIVSALYDVKLSPLAYPPLKRLPILERPVRFAEVQEKIFAKTCIHCHADDSLDLGEGGPGTSGGFGYDGTGLRLSSYTGVASGSYVNGRRASVFRNVNGTPLLLAQLLARQQEERGVFTNVVGMPLGLPALTAEEIQLVETWIAQGRPQ
jgi:hypothetical protein